MPIIIVKTNRKPKIVSAPKQCLFSGDPHIYGFDRSHHNEYIVKKPGEYYLVKSPSFILQGRFGFTRRFGRAAAMIGYAIGGSILNGHTLVLENPDPQQDAEGNVLVFWDKKEIFTNGEGEWQDEDGTVKAFHNVDLGKEAAKKAVVRDRDIAAHKGKGKKAFRFELKYGVVLTVFLSGENMDGFLDMPKFGGDLGGLCGVWGPPELGPHEQCPQNGKWEHPLDMKRHDETSEKSWQDCQKRCAKVSDCKHFTWWKDGGCHITDDSAKKLQSGSSLQGPPSCPPGSKPPPKSSGNKNQDMQKKFDKQIDKEESLFKFGAAYLMDLIPRPIDSVTQCRGGKCHKCEELQDDASKYMGYAGSESCKKHDCISKYPEIKKACKHPPKDKTKPHFKMSDCPSEIRKLAEKMCEAAGGSHPSGRSACEFDACANAMDTGRIDESIIEETIETRELREGDVTCFEDSSRWEPLDMDGEDSMGHDAEDASECQAKCASVSSCAHFTYFPDTDDDGSKKCHLQDENAKQVKDDEAIAGPPSCITEMSGEMHQTMFASAGPGGGAGPTVWLPLPKLVSDGAAKVGMSSTGHGGTAERAVDGSIAAGWDAGSCTHTNDGGTQWWNVDLDDTYKLEKVEITNRADCCEDRMNNIKVLVDGKECGKGPDKVGKGETFSVECPVVGKSLKVQSHGTLTICELQLKGRKATEDEKR